MDGSYCISADLDKLDMLLELKSTSHLGLAKSEGLPGSDVWGGARNGRSRVSRTSLWD